MCNPREKSGNGTKIDNLVQVGHGVRLGENNVLCGQVGIAGSTVLEDGVVLGGQVGIVGHVIGTALCRRQAHLG